MNWRLLHAIKAAATGGPTTSIQFIYTSSGAADNTARKIDLEGNEVWSYQISSGSDVLCSAPDPDGNVYYGLSSGGTVGKLSSDGVLLWEVSVGASAKIWSITASSAGAYIAHGDGNVYHIDPSGNLVWTFTGHAGTVLGISLSPNGYLYTSSQDDTVRRLSIEGAELASVPVVDVYKAVEDDAGQLYTASFDQTVRQFDAALQEVWTFTGHSGAIRDVVFSPIIGGIYTASEDNTARRISSSGTQVWSYLGTGAFYGVAIDDAGNAYAGGFHDSSAVIKLDKDKNLIWTFTGHSGLIFGVNS